MEKEEELSVDEVLSSIREAVLKTKSPSSDSEKEDGTSRDKKEMKEVFVLGKNMLVDNSTNVSLSEKDFDKTSESLLKRYAKVFATWQAFDQNKTK